MISQGFFNLPLRTLSLPLQPWPPYSRRLPRACPPLRDLIHTDDPLDPAITLLDRDIQQHISQVVQDQWRSLIESSDRATNPKRNWSILCKMGGKSSSPSPNISTAYEGKTHYSSQRLHKPSTDSLLPVLSSMDGHSESLWGTSAATIVAYLRGRKASYLYQLHNSPSRQVRPGCPHWPHRDQLSPLHSLTTLCRIAPLPI